MEAIDYEKWRHALALTESSDNWRAWGDEGLAAGRWQMHPAFVWDYGPDNVAVRDSWDQVFSATLWNFFSERQAVHTMPLRIAMEFHLGVDAVEHGKWDTVYAQRFSQHYDRVLTGGES